MASVAIPERSGASQELASVLSPAHQLFAYAVASGKSYRAAAEAAGFSENHGFRIMQMPAVRARVAELVSQPAERLRAGIDLELSQMRNRLADEIVDQRELANVDMRLKVIMAQAKLNGWIVDKKQVGRVSLNMSARSAADLSGEVSEMLDALEPGARAEIERSIEARRARRASRGASHVSAPALTAANDMQDAIDLDAIEEER
jgi:hypothetical protein